MNFKDKLIKRLVDVGKKHRILVYPMLILVAIISAISHAVYWGKGNGRKLVASVAIVALLITQSLFLTSSADMGDSPEPDAGATVSDETPVDVDSPDGAIIDEGSVDEAVLNDEAAEDSVLDEGESLDAANADNNDIADDNMTDGTLNAEGESDNPDGSELPEELLNDDIDVLGAEGDEGTEETPISNGVKYYMYYTVNGSAATSYLGGSAVNETGEANQWFSSADAKAAWEFGDYKGISVSGPFFDTAGTPADNSAEAFASDTATKDGDGNVNVYFIASRVSYDVVITSAGTTLTATDTVPYVSSDLAIAGSAYTIKSAEDYGLVNKGYTFNGLSGSYISGDKDAEVTVNVASLVSQIDAEAVWTPQPFKVKCYVTSDAMEDKVTLADPSNTYIEVNCIYGQDVSLPNASTVSGYATSKGYYFSGWQLGGNEYTSINASELAEFAEGSNDVNEYGKDLVAVWKYRNVTPSLVKNASSTGKTTVEGLSITAEYGDTVNVDVLTNYVEAGDGSTSVNNFSYEITSGNGDLAALGLNISTTTDSGTGKVVGFNINGTLNNINTDWANVVITITDENKLDSAGKDSFTIKVKSNKKQVTIVPSSIKNGDKAVTKAYDGDAKMTVSDRCDVETRIGSDEVYAKFSTEAEADNEKAGTGKALTIKNVTLDGAKAGFYELLDDSGAVVDGGNITIPGIATITQGSIALGIELVEGESDSILFGQATPKYRLYITNPENLAESDIADYEADNETFIKNKLGFTGEYSCARTLYSNPGEYSIYPVIDTSKANYLSTSPSAKFTVSRESGNGHYELQNSPVNGIYADLKIIATNDYDKIRLLDDGEGDIAESMSKASATALFDNVVSVPNMQDGTVRIQMLNSSTGAITEIVTLEHISVDRNCPSLESFSVTPAEKFNEFNFGTYYHAQEVDGIKVEAATLKFTYSSTGSECDKFYYEFLDEDGNVRGNITHEVKMTKDESTGLYHATITIGTGTYGKLRVYATNLVGTPSDVSYIKLNESLSKMTDYYEWMVENSISASDIKVVDSKGNTAVSGVWYNSLSYSTTATDNDSGIQYMVWNISYPGGTSEDIKENTGSDAPLTKVKSHTFSGTISSDNIPSGEYSFGGTLFDNAGNSIVLSTVGPFKLDCKKPVINDNTVYPVSGYDNSINFTFTATEGAEESGIAVVKLLKDGEEIKSWSPASNYEYEITENGLYVVEATDNAGNVETFEKKIEILSTVKPVTPEITIDGVKGNGDWYIEKEPSVTIVSQKDTSDGIPVDTYYNIIVGNKKLERTATTEKYSFDLSNDIQGEVTIEAWSVSRSGVSSDTAKKTIYVDTDKPDLYITESTADESGNLTINFKSTDTVSGVNTSKVLVNGKIADVSNNDGVISGSFFANSATAFEISAEDIAGNKADTVKFVPMGLEVSPIMDIEDTSAYLSAQVVKGTYDIAECYIQYKKATASTYETALANKYDNERGKQIDYTFRNLTPDTEYDYKVYASTLTSKEVKTYEGRFKTSSKESTGVVYGTASYDTNLTEGAKTYPIYVALYSGNTYIKSAKIDSADDNDFKFTDVADGTYRVVATNGELTKETSVIIERGTVTYPSTYVSDGGVNFVLTGLSTEVVLEDNTVALTVDGLEKIYNTGLYNGNVTPEDLAVVNQGGTIKITLYASYIDVSSVSDTTETIFEDRLGNEAVIERYINIEVVKEVRNAEGQLVNGTPKNITTLAEPVTLSFPLGSLSGENIHVASLHGSGSDYSFKSWVNGSEAVLSTNYITITTDRFSVYALYRYEIKDIYYTVKWLDGDGNVMKTETVKSGESATPPTETPTKKATDKYTYEFEGWDTDYSAITADTIVSAWFTDNKIVEEPENKDGNNNGNGDNNSGNTDNGNNNNNNNNNNSGSGSGNKNNDGGNKTNNPPSTTVKPGTTTNITTNTPSGSGAGDISTAPVRYTYMGSASSPKTGDAAPIAVVMVVMLTSAVGMVVLRKKAKENE